MEAFYGLPPGTPLPRAAAHKASPDSPQCVVDFDVGAIRGKAPRRISNSSDVSTNSNGSNPITVTSDDDVSPNLKVERRKPKITRAKSKDGIGMENSQSNGMDASEASASSMKRKTAKPKSSRHNWMSTMGPGGGGDGDCTGSLAPKRTSRRTKVSDTVSLSAMSVAASVQSESSDVGGSTASAMRKTKKKKPSSRGMSKHSSTLSVGGSMRGSRTYDPSISRLGSSASVGGQPRVSSKSSSRRTSSNESLQPSKSEESAGKAAIRAADKKVQRRLSTKGAPSKSALVTASNATSRPPMKKAVSFDSVEVREYARILGDNPSVRKGPPISLDWDYIVAFNLDVEVYETKRGNRRRLTELQMPRYLRETLLREHCDITERELAQCMREIQKVKRQRQQSVAMQDGAQVLLEKAGRGLKRIFQKKSNKKEEEDLWESAKQFAILKMQKRELDDLSADVGDDDTIL